MRTRAHTALPLFLTTRPTTRADCLGHAGPCPWASCRHSLLADVLRGRAAEAHPSGATCALDVADEGAHTLEQTASLLGGLSHQVVHDIERGAEAKVHAAVEATRPSGVYRVAGRRRAG